MTTTAPAAAGARESRGRIPELEGLRAVLAWTVVGAHLLICCGWFGPNVNGIPLLSQVSQAAVDLFIVLSGFAIARLLMVEREPIRIYLLRRACRILPAYWVALTAAIALNGWLVANLRLLPPSADTQGLVMICEIGASRIWIDAALHYTLLHGLAPVPLLPWAPFTFLGAAWSLSLEWQFYCIAPFALLFAMKKRFGLALLVLLSIAGLLFADYWMNWVSIAFIGIKGGFLLAGALTFAASRRSGNREPTVWKLLLPCYVAALLWWLGSGRAVEAVLTAAGATAVIAAAFGDRLRPVSNFLNSRVLQYLGRVSYSTYLFHVPLFTVLQRGIWKFATPQTRLQLFVWTLLSGVVATLIVSELSWRYIERPFQRLGRRSAGFRGHETAAVSRLNA